MHGWPYKRDKLDHSIRNSLPIRSELAMIDDIAMRNNRIINPFSIAETNPTAFVQQPHWYRGMKLLAHEPVYCININTDIENTERACRMHVMSPNTAT